LQEVYSGGGGGKTAAPIVLQVMKAYFGKNKWRCIIRYEYRVLKHELF
jgi:hypothetical protein